MFCFGKRKIQSVRYSYTVPLPVDWVKNQGLGRGDAVDITMMSDGSLRLTPSYDLNKCQKTDSNSKVVRA